jgi:two-component system CheB/CheR fusion protein
MLLCRNTLMYFNAETQSRILARFQFALNDHGILFLGRAETLMTHATSFVPIDLKRRISAKIPNAGGAIRDRLLAANRTNGNGGPATGGVGMLPGAALDAIPTAQLIIDPNGNLAAINERARVLFGIPASDVGRPLQDLKISYRPVELRAAIETSYADRRAVIVRDIEWSVGNGDPRSLELHVVPLIETDGTASILGASVAFHDVTLAKRLQRDLERSNIELSAAQEELQSTNEELETTNEELQSTVEELETTNEELQSTNEELETMNEELQSTNEELQTINDELRQRSDDLNQANGFLESILTSMRGAVMVLDSELRVLVWNESAHELWGLREEEVRGRHIFGLDIGLPIDRLRTLIRACLSGAKPHASTTLEAVNRRGRTITCHANISPLVTRGGGIKGIILATEEAGVTQAKVAKPAKAAKPAKKAAKKGSRGKVGGKRRG